MGLGDRDYMNRNKEGSKLSETTFDSVSGELTLDDKPKHKKFSFTKDDFLRRSGFHVPHSVSSSSSAFKAPNRYSTPVILFWVFVFIVFIYWLSSFMGVNDKYKVTDAELASVGAPVGAPPVSSTGVTSTVPMPVTSVLSAVFAIDQHNPPFSIFAPAGGYSYYWKLKDYSTNTMIMTGFVRSGETLKTNVPAGTYYLETASGTDWQGDVNLFGSYTQIQRSEEPLVFTRYGGNSVSMVHRADGNLKELSIPRSSF